MAKKKTPSQNDFNSFLNNFNGRTTEENVELNSLRNLEMQQILSESPNFNDFKKNMSLRQQDSEFTNNEKIEQNDQLKNKKIAKELEEGKKIGNKLQANLAYKFAVAQIVPLVKQIGAGAVDFAVMKSRSVTNEIKVKEIDQAVSQGLSLATSLYFSALIFSVDATSLVARNIFEAIKEREELRQTNEQNQFDRTALGDLRLNGGR